MLSGKLVFRSNSGKSSAISMKLPFDKLGWYRRYFTPKTRPRSPRMLRLAELNVVGLAGRAFCVLVDVAQLNCGRDFIKS